MIALLAGLDAFILIVPTDGLLVGAAMLAPRRWIATTIIVSLGSSLGYLLFAYLLEKHGLPFLLHWSPGLDQASIWMWSNSFFDKWGALALFLVAVGPVPQQPAVALAALAAMPLWEIFSLVLLGRLLKYGFLCWIGTHAPNLLTKLWGMKKELQEVGIAKE